MRSSSSSSNSSSRSSSVCTNSRNTCSRRRRRRRSNIEVAMTLSLYQIHVASLFLSIYVSNKCDLNVSFKAVELLFAPPLKAAIVMRT